MGGPIPGGVGGVGGGAGGVNWGPGGQVPVQPAQPAQLPPVAPRDTTISRPCNELIDTIDAVLARHGMQRGDPAQPFKVNMHFKRHPENPNSVLMEVLDNKYFPDKDGKPGAKKHDRYAFPMEIEIKFKDGSAEKFPFLFETTIDYAHAANDKNTDPLEKMYIAKTPEEQQKRNQYHAYLQAQVFRHLIKTGTNRGSPRYEQARDKIKQVMKDPKVKPLFTLAPSKVGRENRIGLESYALSKRSITEIGIGVHNDPTPFTLDLKRKKVFATTDPTTGTFTVHKKDSKRPSDSYEMDGVTKNRRTDLLLDENQPFIMKENMLKGLAPPQDSDQLKDFKNKLDEAGVSDATIFSTWPRQIENDLEVFKKDSKKFIKFPTKLLSLGTIRNFFLRKVLNLHGTPTLRSLNKQMEQYLNDELESRLVATNPKKPRSAIGKAQKARNEAILKLEESKKFFQEKVQLTHPTLTLEDFRKLPDDQRDALFTPEEKIQFVELESTVKVAETTLKALDSKFEKQRQALNETYNSYVGKLKELERLESNIRGRNQFIVELSNNDDAWANIGIGQREGFQKRLVQIGKDAGKIQKQLADIQKHFVPNDLFVQKLNTVA